MAPLGKCSWGRDVRYLASGELWSPGVQAGKDGDWAEMRSSGQIIQRLSSSHPFSYHLVCECIQRCKRKGHADLARAPTRTSCALPASNPQRLCPRRDFPKVRQRVAFVKRRCSITTPTICPVLIRQLVAISNGMLLIGLICYQNLSSRCPPRTKLLRKWPLNCPFSLFPSPLQPFKPPIKPLS